MAKVDVVLGFMVVREDVVAGLCGDRGGCVAPLFTALLGEPGVVATVDEVRWVSVVAVVVLVVIVLVVVAVTVVWVKVVLVLEVVLVVVVVVVVSFGINAAMVMQLAVRKHNPNVTAMQQVNRGAKIVFNMCRKSG